MSTNIGSLIAVFDGDISKFNTAVAQVEARMKAVARSVDANQKNITASIAGGQKQIASGELSLQRQLSAVASLEKQRSAALLGQFTQSVTVKDQIARAEIASVRRVFDQVKQTEGAKAAYIEASNLRRFQSSIKAIEKEGLLAAAATATQRKIGSGEISLAQQLSAVASLQKQRSTALLQQWKQQAVQATASQKTIGAGELTLAQQLSAVASLHRQRSAALLGSWKQQERAALQAAAGVRPFREVIQSLSTSIATLQGPLGGVSGRLSSIATLAGGLTASTGGLVIALGAAVAATAGAAFGIYKLATASQELGGQIFDLSTKVNFSAETLSSLKVAAELSGGSLESLSTSLGIFNRNLEESKDSSSEISKVFKALNIDITDNERALRQAFTALSIMKDGSQQTALAMKLFGRSGKDVLGILKETGGDIDGFIVKMRELGLVITSSGAKSADVFGDKLTLLQGKIAAIGRQIGTELVPVVSKAADDISQWLKENQGEIGNMAKEVASLVSEIYRLGKAARDITPIVIEYRIIRSIIEKFAPVTGSIAEAGRRERAAAAPPLPSGLPVLAPFQKRAPDQFKFTTAADLVERAQRKALDALQGKEKKGTGGGGGGRGESAAERVAKQALELAKIQLQGAESIYRDAIDKERAYYDQSLTSLETYTQKRIELENERYQAERDVFVKEQKLISIGTFKPGERDVKQADLNQTMGDAERKHFSTVRGIRADDKREQLDADKRHGEAVISLQEASLRSLESNLLRSVSVRRKTAVEAEEEMFVAMQAVFATKGNDLQVKLSQVLINPNQAREVQDQIDALNLEVQQSVKEHFQKLDDARQQDVESVINYSQQIRSIANDIIGIELDTARIRVQAIRDNTLYRTQAIQEEARIEKAAEKARAADQIKGLREQKERIKSRPSFSGGITEGYKQDIREMKAIDQQIAAIERNAAARQIEIHRQAQEQILEKWREVATDITDILSAGITGGFKGALDEVKSLLDSISREILNSAIIKILKPGAENQGSKAGGLVGEFSNKILDLIGLGRKKETPPGITLSRGDERRPRVFGEPGTLAEKPTAITDPIVVSQTQATRELNRARTEQTHQLVNKLNAIAEHICQCSQPARESFTEGLLKNVIPAAISAIPAPTRSTLRRTDVSSIVRDFPELGGEILSGGGTGGGTRPRIVNQPVSPTTVIDASENVSTSIVNQTREQNDVSTTQTQDLKNTIQLTGQSVVEGLTPKQESLGWGLFGAAIQGALSGLAGGFAKDIGKWANEAKIPKPTTQPRLTPRAAGGPVSSRETYIVGEKGEELFTPKRDGYIIPNSEISNVKNINNQIVKNQTNKTVSNQQKSYIKNFVSTIKNEMARVTEPHNTQNSVSSVINNLVKGDRKQPVEKAIQLLERRVPELRIMQTDSKETSVDRYFKESFKSIQPSIHYPKVEGRALGGPVSFGKTYVVGEQGREVFKESSHTENNRTGNKVSKETNNQKESVVQRFVNTIKTQLERVTERPGKTVEKVRDKGPRRESVSNITNQNTINNAGPEIESTDRIQNIVKTITNSPQTSISYAQPVPVISPKMPVKHLVSVIQSLVPSERKIIETRAPAIKIMLEPSINKESSIEKILKESVKTDRLFPRVEGRAMGGPVRVGLPYDVHKDERIIPTQPGQVFNQSQMNSRGDVINNYTIQLPPSPKGSYQSPKSKRELAESLIAALQSQS